MRTESDLVISFAMWHQHKEINKDFIDNIIYTTLLEFENFANCKHIAVSVLLTSDGYMSYLNNKYLQKNKPTNVLAFPEINFDYKKIAQFKPNNNYLYLGNISLGYKIIKTQAQEYSISFLEHFAHLMIHAVLHLLGFDHKYEQDAVIMEHLERRILRNIDNKS